MDFFDLAAACLRTHGHTAFIGLSCRCCAGTGIDVALKARCWLVRSCQLTVSYTSGSVLGRPVGWHWNFSGTRLSTALPRYYI
jgi:hypothetical protein